MEEIKFVVTCRNSVDAENKLVDFCESNEMEVTHHDCDSVCKQIFSDEFTFGELQKINDYIKVKFDEL